ncbi:MAG: class I SAM-dependent methyltransferase [Thermodesulfobacteriota bacterium]|nr:class I SAM-dependent methyltransferase [Thermodesulfobacteriota bacterium]
MQEKITIKEEVNNPCFICGSNQSDPFLNREFSNFDYPGEFFIRSCKGCGLLFNSPRLKEDEIPALYRKNYYFFNRTDQNEFKRIIEVYRRSVPLIQNGVFPKKALDIGSAKGYLLALLKELNWKVQGIELSKEAASYAINKFGVPTFKGTLEEFVKEHSKEKYPLILAIDILEHIVSPKNFIATIYQLLEDDGFLIIDTPNAQSANITYEKLSWKGFNPFHIFLFSKGNLIQLMENSGYFVENVFSYGNDERKHEYKKQTVNTKRKIKNILEKVYLLNISERIFQRIKEQLYTIWHRRTYLIDAVSCVQDNLSYFDSEDSLKPLANDCRGDNIVLIARKV